MVRWLGSKNFGPIGVDVGSRSVKLVQFTADGRKLIDAVRRELPPEDAAVGNRGEQVATAMRQAREGRRFRGNDAVLCLSGRDLFVQNIRVPKVPGPELEKLIRQEAISRIPYAVEETEIRFLQAADVRQGDTTKREVIVLACHRPVLEKNLKVAEDAGLRPVAVDVEPAALLRSYVVQYRREEDRDLRALFAHVGASSTAVVIAHGPNVLFVKYIDVGGRHLDESVARHLQMPVAEATTLRRHSGDRRSDHQDEDISRVVAEAMRPVVDRLASELSHCMRYHSVTFRGQPLVRIVLGGIEAVPSLAETLAARLDVQCEVGDPLRSVEAAGLSGRRGQWDVATGLALRKMD